MKFFFGILAFIAAAVIVVLLVVSLFRSFGDNTVEGTVSSVYALSDEAAVNTVARYRIVGPVVAEENHRELRITISKNARTIEIIKGYNGTVDKTQTYDNTPEAYRAFLGALEAARFSNVSNQVNGNPATTCVTGSKYFYELTAGIDRRVDAWTTSCSYSHGNFAGNNEATAQIFRAQIPNYSEITTGLNISTL